MQKATVTDEIQVRLVPHSNWELWDTVAITYWEAENTSFFQERPYLLARLCLQSGIRSDVHMFVERDNKVGTILLQMFRVLKNYICGFDLKDREAERAKQRGLLFAGLISSCLQQPKLDQSSPLWVQEPRYLLFPSVHMRGIPWGQTELIGLRADTSEWGAGFPNLSLNTPIISKFCQIQSSEILLSSGNSIGAILAFL